MSLTWIPLEVPAGATPEEAFAAGAVHSHDSQVILLAWVKGKGWGGARAVPGRHIVRNRDVDQCLLRVDDCHITASNGNVIVSDAPEGNCNAQP